MSESGRGVEDRLRRLERGNRFLLVLCAVGVLAGLAGVGGGDGRLTVRSLELVDEGGSVRAALFLEDGAPVFQLADARGEARLRLFHDQDATGMTIMDGQGTTRIGVAQFAHGGGGVALHGPDSRGAVVLYLKEQGSLRIFDGDGAVTFQLPQAR